MIWIHFTQEVKLFCIVVLLRFTLQPVEGSWPPGWEPFTQRMMVESWKRIEIPRVSMQPSKNVTGGHAFFLLQDATDRFSIENLWGDNSQKSCRSGIDFIFLVVSGLTSAVALSSYATRCFCFLLCCNHLLKSSYCLPLTMVCCRSGLLQPSHRRIPFYGTDSLTAQLAEM